MNSEAQLNARPMIFKQISKVMGEIDAIGKDRKNHGQNFNFRGIDDIYNELHPKLSAAGLFTVPEVLEERREERPTSKGTINTHVIMRIKYTIFAEDGSHVSAVMVGEGSDFGDKASTKAQAIAHKYFFLQVFAIPTEDDGDGSKDGDGQSHVFKQKAKPNAGPAKGPLAEARANEKAAEENPASYKITFGPHKNKFIGDVKPSDLEAYMKVVRSEAEKNNKPITGTVAEFMTAGTLHLSIIRSQKKDSKK